MLSPMYVCTVCLKIVLQLHTAIISQRHVLFTVVSLLVGTLSPVPTLKRL